MSKQIEIYMYTMTFRGIAAFLGTSNGSLLGGEL